MYIFSADSEDKVYEALGPNWGKNVLFCGQKEFFQIIRYFHFCLRIVPYRCTKGRIPRKKFYEVLFPGNKRKVFKILINNTFVSL